MNKVLLNEPHITNLSSASRTISSAVSANRDQIVLDKFEVTLTQRGPKCSKWGHESIHSDAAKYLMKPKLSTHTNGNITVGDKWVATNGRELLVNFMNAQIVYDKIRSNEISLNNLMSDIEFWHLERLSAKGPVNDWLLKKAVELIEELKVYLYERSGGGVLPNSTPAPNIPATHKKIETILGGKYVSDFGYDDFCKKSLYPMRIQALEFAKDIPRDKSAVEYRGDFERAISTLYGTPYHEKTGKAFSYDWHIPNLNKNKKEKLIIKCYPKGDFMRIEVRFQGIPKDANTHDSAKFLKKLQCYADLASKVIQGVQQVMNQSWNYPHYRTLEVAIFKVLPRSKNDNRIRELIDTLAKYGAYTPIHASNRVNANSLTKLVTAGILQRSKQAKFNSIGLTTVHGSKNTFPLAANWYAVGGII